jgi:hypothetical protein
MKDASNMDLLRAGFFGAIGGAAFYLTVVAIVAAFAPRPVLAVTAGKAGDCGCGCGGK